MRNAEFRTAPTAPLLAARRVGELSAKLTEGSAVRPSHPQKRQANSYHPKAPLCKGSCHGRPEGAAMTEGLCSTTFPPAETSGESAQPTTPASQRHQFTERPVRGIICRKPLSLRGAQRRGNLLVRSIVHHSRNRRTESWKTPLTFPHNVTSSQEIATPFGLAMTALFGDGTNSPGHCTLSLRCIANSSAPSGHLPCTRLRRRGGEGAVRIRRKVVLVVPLCRKPLRPFGAPPL